MFLLLWFFSFALDSVASRRLKNTHHRTTLMACCFFLGFFSTDFVLGLLFPHFHLTILYVAYTLHRPNDHLSIPFIHTILIPFIFGISFLVVVFLLLLLFNLSPCYRCKRVNSNPSVQLYTQTHTFKVRWFAFWLSSGEHPILVIRCFVVVTSTADAGVLWLYTIW